MCRISAELGVQGFDLVGPKDFPVLKKYGLIPSMVPGGSGIKKGINDPANHAEIEPRMREAIREAAAAGAPSVIVLAGDREGISDEKSLETSAAFMRKVMPQAEDAGITMCIELLNSKVDHPGYVCDKTEWGVQLCKAIGSPRFSCCTTSTTCRSWREISSAPFATTFNTLATSTLRETPGAMSSTKPRS